MHNLVELLFGKLKKFHWVATRNDKAAQNFLSAGQLAASRFLHRRIANPLFEATASLAHLARSVGNNDSSV